jgi:hypothetical protein
MEKEYLVEEQAEKLTVRKSELAAIMAMQGWKYGKKVSERVFKEALNTFLSAPMGGK